MLHNWPGSQQHDRFQTSDPIAREKIADGLALPMLLLSALSLPMIGPGGALVVLNGNAVYQVRILTPLGVLNFLNLAARSHILIKDGRVLELLNRVDTVIFDKTGTLTLNEPTVTEIYTVGEISADELLWYAAAAERKQSHPIAQAILQQRAQVPTAGNCRSEL
ncbi:MAG: HAD family hydrolase [Caldilineaceae bacterium]